MKGTAGTLRAVLHSGSPQALMLALLALAWLGSVHAGAPRLSLPVDCDRQAGCMVQNHFDHDPGPGFVDYACGRLGYDGHKGVDFRLPNMTHMHRGEVVRAAAAGRVRAIRDEMNDVSIGEPGQLQAIAGREAGNSVAIQHGDGWETQYSHLRLGSVRVRPGQWVDAGEVIGQIGLSGKTEFPHLHLSVRHDGKPVDPFVGRAGPFACDAQRQPLWDAAALQRLAYRPTGLVQKGFSDRRPTLEAVQGGEHDDVRMSSDSAALVFWIEIFGVRGGDEVELEIRDPQGRTLAQHRMSFDRDKANWFGFIGKKRPPDGWDVGEYVAGFRLTRPDNRPQTVLIVSQATSLAAAP